jgi:hypothetical protein
VKRGWVGKYPYLSPNRQEAMLVRAGVEPRVIYRGRDEWEPFVRALRSGDEAVVADLTIFGSRKALGEASKQVAGRNAVLVPVSSLTPIHHPTLADVQRTESKWAGHRSMGGSKRARELSKRAPSARRSRPSGCQRTRRGRSTSILRSTRCATMRSTPCRAGR